MSHFYGMVQGNRGKATRGGSKKSGYHAQAKGWRGQVDVRLWHDETKDLDWFEVHFRDKHGKELRPSIRGVLQAGHFDPH